MDESNTMISRDLNKCVLCGRCIRACNEIQVNEVLDFSMRGSTRRSDPRSTPTISTRHACSAANASRFAPPAPITFKQAKFAGRPWELEKVHTTCAYCGVGCQMDLYVKDNRIIKVMGNTGIRPAQ
jgi:predicted molibdopterin-dependent oxidoreductase YjgC